MKKALISILVLFLISPTASAAEKTDHEVLQLLIRKLQVEDYTGAKEYLSSGSQTVFDRYSKYNLGSLVPAKTALISQSANPPYRYLKISGANQLNNAPRAMNVAFVTEDNDPKVDIRETLRLGFGPNWPQKLNMMEQTYNFSRMHLGEAESLQILNDMLGK